MPAPLESLDPLALDVWRYGLGDGWRDLHSVCVRLTISERGWWAPPADVSGALARLVAAGRAERAVPGWRRRQQKQEAML